MFKNFNLVDKYNIWFFDNMIIYDFFFNWLINIIYDLVNIYKI